jgi:hypothetical protein
MHEMVGLLPSFDLKQRRNSLIHSTAMNNNTIVGISAYVCVRVGGRRKFLVLAAVEYAFSVLGPGGKYFAS